MRDVKVIPGEEITKQHHLLVCDVCADIPPPAKKKFVSHLRTWRLREPEAQTAYQKTSIMETTSSNASGSGTEGTWEKQKSSLWRQLKMYAGLPRSTGGKKETWWWNTAVDRAVNEKRRWWKTWKKGGSKEEYQKAKRIAKHAVYLATSQPKQEVLKDPSLGSMDLFCLANQMRCENLDIQCEKPARNDAGELCLDDRAKQAAWKEHYERPSNVEFDWGPDSIQWKPPPPPTPPPPPPPPHPPTHPSGI